MIIATTGQKGGSGKSTVAVALAVELQARGHRVLLVDSDPQQTSRTWGAVAVEGGHPAPTVVSLAGDTMHAPGQLPALARDYDSTVVDCPPGDGRAMRAALMVADVAVIPCGPSPVEVWGLARTLDVVRQALTIRPELRAVLLLNRASQTGLTRATSEALRACGIPVLASSFGYRVAFAEAVGAGMGVTEYAPTSEAAREARALTDELLSLEVSRAA